MATEQGTAALFIYAGRAGNRVGLFVRLMIGVDTDAPLRPVSGDAVRGFAWSADGVGHGLVSGDGTPDLCALAAAVRAGQAKER